MTMYRCRIGLFVLFGALVCLSSRAAEDKKDSKDAKSPGKKEAKKYPNTFTDPAEAGKDFLVQGEYEGTLSGKGKMGAQVVARGDGKFDVYLLTGGLPGAGWDTKGKIKLTGAFAKDSDQVKFGDKEWTGTIAGGKLSLGGTPDVLTRVEARARRSERRPPPAP